MTSPPARLDRSTLLDRSRALRTEWLESDGVGGFAMGSVLGARARRYHGLLVATPDGLARRHQFLARWQDRLILADGTRLELSPATPDLGRGFPAADAIESFTIDPAPTWTLELDGYRLEREILVPKGRAAVLCRWSLLRARLPLTLELVPWLTCRELDRLHHRNTVLDPRTRLDGDVVRVRPYAALPELCLGVGATPRGFRFEEEAAWTIGVELAIERERGYDDHEDEFAPGCFAIPLHEGESVIVAAALERPVDAPETLRERVLDLRRKAMRLRSSATRHAPLRARLEARADEFLYVDRGGRLGVIAGHPWFGEWGRDTFISLPGLTLARERVDQCAKVLAGVLPLLADGLVPNVFGTCREDSQYGSVDAALWYARAIDLWRRAGGVHPRHDAALDAALLEIATRYHEGTALGIRVDEDGLLVCGGAELNATWMDAQLADGPVTPRDGKPVEIVALWCALLDQVAERAPDAALWRTRRDRAWQSFRERFWVADPHTRGAGWLADRLDRDGHQDPSVRPNMVLAAALARSPLDDRIRAAVLAVTECELLTPRGLRTLSNRDPRYRGHYGGDVVSRDRAYHQGTVWPWLIGSYVELALRVRGDAAVPALRAVLDGFSTTLDEAGLGFVSEVHDGDPPHRPGGAIAQAWSSAELLRAYALLEERS